MIYLCILCNSLINLFIDRLNALYYWKIVLGINIFLMEQPFEILLVSLNIGLD